MTGEVKSETRKICQYCGHYDRLTKCCTSKTKHPFTARKKTCLKFSSKEGKSK